MDLTIVQYIVFTIVSLILILAVIGLNRRLDRHNKSHSESLNNWIELDAKRTESREELPPEDLHLNEVEQEIKAELHARARQNGHHAESQKPQY